MFESVQQKIRTVKEEIERENLSEDQLNARLKSEKIKIALEKIKEANVKKLYVKIFTKDGGSKSILVDERWTIADVLFHLAEKHHIILGLNHAIIEYYPDLYMERIYEDHEYLVENILMWTRDSTNKLVFAERREKYDLFLLPEKYLLDKAHADKRDFSPRARQELVKDFFAPSQIQPPETEGVLYLKSDGKKSWRKHYFVLRSSGLYYIPKGKSKAPKDLTCLMQLDMVNVYTAVNWQKKFKAPTEFGFALKV
ncbi:unnamed protein product [Soboliphyme baturini]|uniref:Ras-associating domain-containing protein n=1 Tax=Soboliphyme baturini TaxID=241478 RepID=A0A3P8GYL1_9BILA|nr:unnamed protein product [Soboliphyme baturini]